MTFFVFFTFFRPHPPLKLVERSILSHHAVIAVGVIVLDSTRTPLDPGSLQGVFGGDFYIYFHDEIQQQALSLKNHPFRLFPSIYFLFQC